MIFGAFSYWWKYLKKIIIIIIKIEKQKFCAENLEGLLPILYCEIVLQDLQLYCNRRLLEWLEGVSQYGYYIVTWCSFRRNCIAG